LQLFSDDYDVVLLDIGLPDIDGIEICKRMRKKIKDKYLPIIAITAFGATIKATCIASGFTEFIQKPIDMVTLKEMIERTVKRYS